MKTKYSLIALAIFIFLILFARIPVAFAAGSWVWQSGFYDSTCTVPADYGGNGTCASDMSGDCTAAPFYASDGTIATCAAWTGDCLGKGGTDIDTYKCVVTAPPPINGSCSATHYNCSSGTSVNGTYNAGTGVYSWKCNGANGGTNANCTENTTPLPVNGVCAPTHYSCIQGTQNPVSFGYNAGSAMYYWYCDGLNGGTQSYCFEYVPVNGVCNNTVTNGCSSGNSANPSTSGGYFYWSCNGINGGTNDTTCKRLRSVSYANLSVNPSTVPYGGFATYSWTSGPNAENCLLRQGLPPGAVGTVYPPNSSMTIGPLYSSRTYNGYCINGTDPSMWYFGPTGNPWGDFVTVTVLPLNGACSANHYTCSAGTSVGGYDAGDRWLWDCQGANGGTTAAGCTEMKPIDGVCSSLHYSCNTAPLATNTANNLTTWTWTCPGQYGGLNTSCTENKIPVNGVCSATHYSCAAGNSANNFFDGAYFYSWNCNGANGGTNASCTQTITPPPVNGVCAMVHYGCNVGTSIGGYDAGDAWRWNCAGSNGGSTAVCAEFKPFDGVCAASHYACAVGASTANVDGATKWTWTCNGGYGGLPANCMENKPAPLPVVTWTPSAVTIDYNTKVSYSYAVTNAVSCIYEDIDPASGSVLSTIDPNAPFVSSWVGPQGEYQRDVRRRLTCKNSDGASRAAEIYITVRQNDATCLSVTAPSYLAPNEAFTATAKMQNTGTNPWSANFGANYVLWNADPAWSPDNLQLTNAPVPAGSVGNFSGSLAAPSAEKDYDFIWQMRPVFSGNWWPVFGQPCSITTSIGNKIRVKSPTLGVDPQSYQFSDVVLGDAPSIIKIHVKNLGGGKITGVKITPADLSVPFSCIAHCDITLLGGGEDDITLAFSPVATGTVSRNVHLVSNEGYPLVITAAGQPVAVDYLSIYGRGTDKFSISTDDTGLNTVGNVDFGEVAWTRTKYSNITIWNKSLSSNGNISPNIDPSVAYACISGCSPISLPPGGHRTIRLRFTPPYKSVQTYDGVLNLGALPDIHYNITGIGIKPEFTTTEK